MYNDQFNQVIEPVEGPPRGDYTRFHIYEPGTALLFVTHDRPNCEKAIELLEEAGVDYVKVISDENFALVNRYGIRWVPVLCVVTRFDYVPYFGVNGVKEYIERVKNGQPTDVL